MAALHTACFTTPRPWSACELTGIMGTPGVFLSESAFGFALGRVVVDEAELLTLAVSPAHRRHGTGRALLAAFEAEARAEGARTAFLEVSADNAAALALYESSDYRQTGQRPGYYTGPDGTRIDALIYAKSLD
ncbi:ribosomal-protein-alanine N-acetyltransferase [Aliiruegeria haliotis]|uniref:Ribosomal-protein-alanine N-acetyltransferase n=2 Tax=Aliiruegeria haliotis TaxID=1280846 RepID=A0A2T0RWJ6_9RHOB|nr:ribosomal-protein-alanine N-acetyltransferase [Aliiruegeria haliotis]